jgi:TPR repeat protein
MYATGQDVQQDNARAHMWFSLAAAQGEQRERSRLEKWPNGA